MSSADQGRGGEHHLPGSAWAAALLAGAVVLVLAARVLGPSDVHHQTQPRTVSYTTDMLVHGRWVLPLERGSLPATKPPLYNWVAAPFVRVMGFDSALAHKMPSVLGFLACAAALAWLGERVLGRGMGFLAALMLVATYAMFKLGFLARPDMLLTLWLALAWMAATRVMVGVSRQPSAISRQNEAIGHQPLGSETEEVGTRNPELGTPQARSTTNAALLTFWLAVALAWLTKGPPAMVALIFPLLIARPMAGRLGAVNTFRWWWGVPLSLLPFVAWIIAVHQINPDHLVRTLWEDELYGRVVGTHGEAPEAGPLAWITTSLHMPAYFLVRAAPWSGLTLAAFFLLWRRGRRAAPDATSHRAWGRRGVKEAWLLSAAAWVGLVVVIFSLSAGKRADYIAAAYPPGMLLAAWALGTLAIRARVLRHLPIPAALVTLGLLAWANGAEVGTPVKGVGSAYDGFIRDARRLIDADPLPVFFTTTGGSHVQAFLGSSMPETAASLDEAFREHARFWLISGDRPRSEQGAGLEVPTFAARRGARATMALRSIELPRTADWPGAFTVWRIEPRGD